MQNGGAPWHNPALPPVAAHAQNFVPALNVHQLVALQAQIIELQQRNAQQANALTDSQLAVSLQHQASLASPSSSSSKFAGVSPLSAWEPSKQSFDDFYTSFALTMINFNIPKENWGLRLLTFIPQDAQLSFFRDHNIKDLSAQNCSIDAVAEFCREHQVAHSQTDNEVRRQIFFKTRQHSSLTNFTAPIGSHVAAMQALFNKCSIPLDQGSKIFAMHNSLHPAVQNMLRLDPSTGKPFVTYDRYRQVLVSLGGTIASAIAEWTRSRPAIGSKRPAGTSDDSNDIPASDTDAANPAYKRGRVQWTPEQKERAANGNCAFCNIKYFPGHKCRGR